MSDDFAARFVRTLVQTRTGAPSPQLPTWWGPELSAKLTDAVERWPTLAVAPETLARYVAARLPDAVELEPGLGQSLRDLHFADLVLACACAPDASSEQRSAGARAFDETYREHLRTIVGRLGQGATFVEEMRQRVYDHLLVGRADRQPRLVEYAGRGPLLAFLRVVATRIALGELRRRDRRREDGDEVMLQAAVDDENLELAHLEATYRKPLEEAFTATLAALPPRARTLLRYQVVDRLSIDKIAAIYDIHRSTAARQLARARQALVEGTHERLRRALGVDADQLESILRLVRSQVDVSVHRLLLDTVE